MFPLLILAAVSVGQAPREDAETFFELKIRPVLAETCLKCHGDKKTENSLRLDSRPALLKGGDGGPAIVPGDPDKSLLIQAIRHTHQEIKMPPGKKLPEQVLADFALWVRQGAAWPKTATVKITQDQKHWAYEPIKKKPAPKDPTGWSGNPIDSFVLSKLREHGLKPAAPADKRALLRRVYFDLIGLPPTPEDVETFLADETAEAFAKVVDRLLASPHYGERWGRHWMDVVRYADTAGDNADYPIPEVRLYRDYIIDSFNADKPYDQFVREQIAGDILAKGGPRHRYAEQVVATGFLALSRRYATAPYELWHLTMEDTIDTVGQAFLGLTLRCARCHDHKFDPITKEDYYGLYGFFASTQFPWAGGEELASKKITRQEFMPLLSPEEVNPRLEAFAQKVKHLEAGIQKVEKEDPLAKRLVELDRLIQEKSKQSKEEKDKVPALQKERDTINGQLQGKLNGLKDQLRNLQKPGLPADLPCAYAVRDGKPVDIYVHIRGDVNQPGPVVQRNVPKFLGGDKPLAIPEGASGRLQLAQWLTKPDNPLTARVMVNRLWQHHFGKGIVGTPSNFGLRGEPPTHPELLDWLAAEFIENG